MVKWGHIIFGGVNSADYGIYITGEAVYNAPERDIEFTDIPGRNGSVAIDKGRYRNITITYPAGAYGVTQKEFREKLTRFRNAIISQVGYQRLEDTYHPDEYRMGVYASGLEVEPVSHGRAGEFNLVFECKPQRFLLVGDFPIPVDSGDFLPNPTPFDARPLLEVKGYGTITMNDFPIALNNVTLGRVVLSNGKSATGTSTVTAYDPLVADVMEDDDVFTISNLYWHFVLKTIGGSSISSASGEIQTGADFTPEVLFTYSSTTTEMAARLASLSFTYGTSETQEVVYRVTSTGSIGGLSWSSVDDFTLQAVYDASENTVTLKLVSPLSSSSIFQSQKYDVSFGEVVGVSSQSQLGNPTYIDCDLGEAYKYENGVMISINSMAILGNDLPVLGPGNNVVTFDNTVEDVKITPRWWNI